MSHDDEQNPAMPPDMADKLHSLQSITDAVLSVLDPQVLLTSLIQRVREIPLADTASILLLDPSGGQLVAAAASGLEEAVRQDVRIPLGKGYAGRVAAQRHLEIVAEVEPAMLVNPVMRAKGVRSLIVAPLLAQARPLGVLHVGSLRPRAFTAQDAEVIQVAADRAALTVQILTAQLDRAAATVLQHSLLPYVPPAVTGLEMATRYVPGHGSVGGDWYDVFSLPDSQVCAIIGDVAGSGLGAAVVMGRMRSALRAYALETADPAAILSRLDRKMRYFEYGTMATVLCAVFSSSLDQVRVSCAGHLPPVVALPGQPVVVADVPPDPVIGISAVKHRHVTTLNFPPGATLCLYTDGLVERRGELIDDGIARLCAAITPDGPEAACASVMTAMANDSPYSDDMALLMLHRERAAAGDGRPGRYQGRPSEEPQASFAEGCREAGTSRHRTGRPGVRRVVAHRELPKSRATRVLAAR